MASLYATTYNGTGEAGCDSLTENCNLPYEVCLPPHPPPSHKNHTTNKPTVWRHSMDPNLLRSRPAHDPRRRLLLQRPRTSQIRSLPNLAILHVRRRRLVPMVLLGLQSHLLSHSQLIHWRFNEYWVQECSGRAECG